MKGLGWLAMAALLPATAFGRVLDFHSDIRIARDGELTVTERITLEVDDRQPHSVLRRELRAPVTVADVIRNGHPEPWLLEPAGQVARLRIGKTGAALAHGRHTYQIAYRSRGRCASSSATTSCTGASAPPSASPPK